MVDYTMVYYAMVDWGRVSVGARYVRIVQR